MFTNDMVESRQHEIKMHGIDATYVFDCLEKMYSH